MRAVARSAEAMDMETRFERKEIASRSKQLLSIVAPLDQNRYYRKCGDPSRQ
jgi:hypothetical protein